MEPQLSHREFTVAAAGHGVLDALSRKAYSVVGGMSLQGLPLTALQYMMVKYSGVTEVQLACLEALTSRTCAK